MFVTGTRASIRRMTRTFGALCVAAVCAVGTRALGAQDTTATRLLSRADAVGAALARGPRLGVARADAALAEAQLVTARAFENPTLVTSYSKSVPQYHVDVDLPFDYPWLRGARIGAAEAGRRAAGYRLAFERAATALDADTTYTRALAARDRAELSRRTAQDADSLRRMAVARRDAGDASDLDVELATVAAGQQANVASGDSLTFLSTLLDLQATIGLRATDVRIVLTDSLDSGLGAGDSGLGTGDPGLGTAAPGAGVAGRGSAGRGAPTVGGPPPNSSIAPPPPSPITTSPPAGASPRDITPAVPTQSAAPSTQSPAPPLSVAAAEASVQSARLGATVQQRSVFLAPTISAGFETHDPSGGEPGILPTVGVSLPLPILNRNRGPIAEARAARMRAEADLALARVESEARIAQSRRALANALARVARDRVLVASANRVVAMSITAYREGAATLPGVLESQRTAREVLAQYVDDLAAAWVAVATLRVLTLTPASP